MLTMVLLAFVKKGGVLPLSRIFKTKARLMLLKKKQARNIKRKKLTGETLMAAGMI
jgi:hypothetical protein